MLYNINKILDFLGDKGPLLLFFFTIIILIINDIKITLFFILGYYINLIVNRILKKYINDKRPFIKPLKNRMPSGHCQSIFYTVSFIYFISYYNKIYIPYFNYLLFIYLLLLINTAHNCIIYKYHTIDQVIIGGVLGIFISYLTVLLILLIL